jgi:hypothetical protein
MRDLDTMIDEAIDEEERDLLRRIGEEPGFIEQALGIFGGKAGWVNAVLMVVMTLLFMAGVWAAWMFFAAGDPVTQLRWGLPAAVLLLTSVMIKVAVWPTVHVNQVLRELKLIELQLARSAGRVDRPAQTIE